MGDYEYSNDLLEQCAKALQRCEAQILVSEETVREGMAELQKLRARKTGIELAISQLQVHAPNSWCRLCKRDCPNPWNHHLQCEKYEAECPHLNVEERTVHGLTGEYVTHCLDCDQDIA